MAIAAIRIAAAMGGIPCFNIRPTSGVKSRITIPKEFVARRFGFGMRRNLPIRREKIPSNHVLGYADSALQYTPVSSTTTEEGNGGDGDSNDDEEDHTVLKITEVKNGVQRYLVAVEYIGTRYSGSQWQPHCRTVVGVLQEAFQNFIGQPVSVFCSSRTDAGVHALSNVCHVDVERISKRRPGEVLPPHDPGVVRKAVNHFLQKNEGDMTVIDVRCVPADFHARFNAKDRTYFYRLLSGPGPLSLFERGHAWHVSEELNILTMQSACNILVGSHDFSSFRGARCQAKSPIKTLDELHVSEVVPPLHFPSIAEMGQNSLEEPLAGNSAELGLPSQNPNCEGEQEFGWRRRHRCFVVTARARSFLYHQVRLLVGVLKSVGTGDLTVNDVEKILNVKDVTASGPMAPACGLYLGKVRYDLP